MDQKILSIEEILQQLGISLQKFKEYEKRKYRTRIEIRKYELKEISTRIHYEQNKA